MKPWTIGIYILVAVAALCLVVALTHPASPDIPDTPSDSTLPPNATAPSQPEIVSRVRLYQCDPKLAEKWRAVAERYTAETGIRVSVLTTTGDCSASLPTYLEGEKAATIFCLHHSYEAEAYRDQCLDLTDSAIANALRQDIFALMLEDRIIGVASNIESYGIIYNSKLLADAGFTVSDITDFVSLSDVVKNITANRKKLGFSAFSAPDLNSTDHGSLLCLLAGLKGSDSGLRGFWDLYTSNNTRSGSKLTQAVKGDGLTDFLNGKAVFYLSGTWDYENFTDIADYYLDMLPVYTPDNATNPGLYHSCTSYWSVNAQATEQEQTDALNFLSWLVTAGEDGTAPVDLLGQVTPYQDAKYAGNPLDRLVLQSLGSETSVQWNSCDTLTPEVLSQFSQALIAYTKDPSDETWAAITALKNSQ